MGFWDPEETLRRAGLKILSDVADSFQKHFFKDFIKTN